MGDYVRVNLKVFPHYWVEMLKIQQFWVHKNCLQTLHDRLLASHSCPFIFLQGHSDKTTLGRSLCRSQHFHWNSESRMTLWHHQLSPFRCAQKEAESMAWWNDTENETKCYLNTSQAMEEVGLSHLRGWGEDEGIWQGTSKEHGRKRYYQASFGRTMS